MTGWCRLPDTWAIAPTTSCCSIEAHDCGGEVDWTGRPGVGREVCIEWTGREEGWSGWPAELTEVGGCVGWTCDLSEGGRVDWRGNEGGWAWTDGTAELGGCVGWTCDLSEGGRVDWRGNEGGWAWTDGTAEVGGCFVWTSDLSGGGRVDWGGNEGGWAWTDGTADEVGRCGGETEVEDLFGGTVVLLVSHISYDS